MKLVINMKIYNTLTREKQNFSPIKSGEVKIYACGPTVYNYIHIGNARPLCVFDVMRRYLEKKGFKVIYVQNFTDVDDKIINKANQEGIDYLSVAQKYIDEYKIDAEGLNIKPATIHPLATENIDQMIDLISTLISKNHAYVVENGDVYFNTQSFSEYGKLSHQPLDDLEAGARVGVGELKKDPMDFALWKSSKPGEPSWDSPWGKGRPGWHIECSAMAKRYLGNTIDIHCGGQDLIFPHHENEIAQSECANGCTFANYWIHNGYINVDNKKMSKSLNNFFTVRDVAQKFGYAPIRYLMIASHYRSPINYSEEIIQQCSSAVERLRNCRDNLNFLLKHAKHDAPDNLKDKFKSFEKKFIDAMEDDFNTADALSVLFDLTRVININLSESSSYDVVREAIKIFDDMSYILGLDMFLIEQDNKSDEDSEAQKILNRRIEARKNKNWAEADRLRDALKNMGYAIEDTVSGARLKKTN